MAKWVFVEHRRSRQWTWRLLGPEGKTVSFSRSFHDYGRAVHDALTHGFKPELHHWVVVTRLVTTHYAPNERAVSEPNREMGQPRFRDAALAASPELPPAERKAAMRAPSSRRRVRTAAVSR